MKKIRHYYYLAAIIQGVFIIASPVARAQDPTTDGYVTRKEYEDLKAQLLAMKKELDAIKKEKATQTQENAQGQAIVESHKKVAPPESSQAQADADTHKQVATEASPPVVEAEGSLLGTTKFLLAGWAEGMYEQRNGQVSTFSASFNPIFLWELTPKILFDSRLEIEPSGGGTNVNLVNAQISYLFNDYVALGVGEFLVRVMFLLNASSRNGSTDCPIARSVFTMASCQTYPSAPKCAEDFRSVRPAWIT